MKIHLKDNYLTKMHLPHNMNNPLTIVELTQTEAESFITFQKHRTLIGLLESIGAFNVRNGSVTIHFSRLGEIISVDKQEHYNHHV